MNSETQPGSPAPLADFLRRHRTHLPREWEALLRAGRPEDTSPPLLGDALPELLEGLAEAAERLPVPQAPPLPPALSDGHLLRRVELGYAPEEAVREYGLVRQCILQGMVREGHLPLPEELALLEATLERGITHVITHHTRVRERRLEALERVSQVALDSEDLDTFLTRLLGILMEVAVTVDGASILLREGDRLRLRAAVGVGAEQALAEHFSIALHEGVTGHVASERLPFSVRSAATHPEVGYALVRELGLRAAYSVPLLRRGALIGVAHMSSRTVFDFSASDQLLFRELLQRATGFIVRAELTEREHAAQATARRSLAQLDMLLEAAPVAIALLDRELRYLGVNEALARLNRYPADAHQGKTLREVVPDDVADMLEPTLRRVLETGEPESNHEFSSGGQPDTGPLRHWLGNYYPVRTPEGEVLGLGCVAMDITRQKQVEAELRHSAELRERLIGVLGHDLRNPLSAIDASAVLLQRDKALGPGGARAAERIRKSASRMERMLSDILDFARSSLGGGLPVYRGRVNLHDVCRSTLEELQVTWPERRFELSVQGDPWGEWDGDRLAQVVGNLVSNALRHGEDDTPVRVELLGLQGEVRLGVHNAGPPIPSELRARLFQPFQHGPTARGGGSVGLGLYIVREVARAHGGDVEVHSASGEGTRFTVRLPRASPADEKPLPT